MVWKRISLLFLLVLTAHPFAEDTRSLEMSTMDGWQLECVNTTCLPSLTVTVPSIRDCQLACLSELQCQAASFLQSTTTCELFTNIQYRNINMLANMEIITMMVISGTRTLPG
jgi:hypothetical protein